MEQLSLRSIEEQLRDSIQAYLDEDGEIKGVTVKLAYEIPEEIEYPLVVINEIENSENTRYTIASGEQVTNLAYQIECICSTTEVGDEILDASRSAKLLATKVSLVCGGKDYKMRRVGNTPLTPITSDRTVMRYIERYECCLFLKQNILYRR